MKISTSTAVSIVEQASKAAGASNEVAASLARAVVAAEWSGNRAVGFAHLVDCLDGLRCGRIAGDGQPSISFPAAATVRVDANRGIAQLGFDVAFDELLTRAKQCGVAVFSQFNSFTVGELGYYTRRLADAGMVAIAACNATAQVTTLESGKPVFGTNPMSFAAPTNQGKSFVIDQASSAAAFARVRQAAAAGESIPEGWAVDVCTGIADDQRFRCLDRIAAAFRRCEGGAHCDDGGVPGGWIDRGELVYRCASLHPWLRVTSGGTFCHGD